MNNRPLGVVVVGTGFGARIHVPALRAAGFTVHALVGRDPERTARRAARLGVAPTTSLAEGLALAGVDAVTVATPPFAHFPVVLDAIAAGKHVLCEKPFALDAAEARAMVTAASRAGVVALVGHEFRWATERALAARAIANGAIGEPRLATFVSSVPLVADPEARVPDWWFDPVRGGGWLGASGSHAVDQVRVWLGEIERVSAWTGTVSARTGTADDSFTIRFRTAAGCEGMLQQSAGAWGPMTNATRVVGSKGTIRLDGAEVWLSGPGGDHRLDVPADLVLPPAPAADERAPFTHLELGPYTRLAEAFAAAIAGGPYTGDPPVPTFADGVACMEVLDAVRRSAALGGEWIDVGHG